MITLIHGADSAQSRNYLTEEKKRSPESITLEADDVNLSDLAQIFQGGGLFGESKNIFLEQFLTKKKKTSDFKSIIEYLNKQADDNAISLWEAKEIEPSIVKLFSKPLVRLFKFPQTLFVFIESIKPGNSKQLLHLFHQTIQNTETEMVFFMLIRQFRLMLALKSETAESGPIDELKRMAPWQKTKIQSQAALFDDEKLLSLYNQLYAIEVGQKTGTITGGMTTAIDFFLLEV